MQVKQQQEEIQNKSKNKIKETQKEFKKMIQGTEKRRKGKGRGRK